MTAAVFAALTLFAPPEPLPLVSLDDLATFPSAATVTAAQRQAQEHLAYLAAYVTTHGDGWGLREWQDEAAELWLIWDDLAAAQLGNPEYVGGGRWARGINNSTDALIDLRNRIGARAYRQGAMPPPVPLWRFTRRD